MTTVNANYSDDNSSSIESLLNEITGDEKIYVTHHPQNNNQNKSNNGHVRNNFVHLASSLVPPPAPPSDDISDEHQSTYSNFNYQLANSNGSLVENDIHLLLGTNSTSFTSSTEAVFLDDILGSCTNEMESTTDDIKIEQISTKAPIMTSSESSSSSSLSPWSSSGETTTHTTTTTNTPTTNSQITANSSLSAAANIITTTNTNTNTTVTSPDATNTTNNTTNITDTSTFANTSITATAETSNNGDTNTSVRISVITDGRCITTTSSSVVVEKKTDICATSDEINTTIDNYNTNNSVMMICGDTNEEELTETNADDETKLPDDDDQSSAAAFDPTGSSQTLTDEDINTTQIRKPTSSSRKQLRYKTRFDDSSLSLRNQKCTLCGKIFGNGSALTKHKLTHSSERKFVCPICKKAFKRQDHLNGHMLTHRQKKPYECRAEGCEKSYCDARSLRRHTENHHLGDRSMLSRRAVPSINGNALHHHGDKVTIERATNTIGLSTSSGSTTPAMSANVIDNTVIGGNITTQLSPMAQLSAVEPAAAVIIQKHRPQETFTQTQQQNNNPISLSDKLYSSSQISSLSSPSSSSSSSSLSPIATGFIADTDTNTSLSSPNAATYDKSVGPAPSSAEANLTKEQVELIDQLIRKKLFEQECQQQQQQQQDEPPNLQNEPQNQKQRTEEQNYLEQSKESNPRKNQQNDDQHNYDQQQQQKCVQQQQQKQQTPSSEIEPTFQKAATTTQNTNKNKKKSDNAATSKESKGKKTSTKSSSSKSSADIPDEDKAEECNLCHKKFKNIPALNGHMRLHGGYFRKLKEMEAKKAEKKATGPALQTVSVNVRALIEEKIILKRMNSLASSSHSSNSSNSNDTPQESRSIRGAVTASCLRNIAKPPDNTMISAQQQQQQQQYDRKEVITATTRTVETDSAEAANSSRMLSSRRSNILLEIGSTFGNGLPLFMQTSSSSAADATSPPIVAPSSNTFADDKIARGNPSTELQQQQQIVVVDSIDDEYIDYLNVDTAILTDILMKKIQYRSIMKRSAATSSASLKSSLVNMTDYGNLFQRNDHQYNVPANNVTTESSEDHYFPADLQDGDIFTESTLLGGVNPTANLQQLSDIEETATYQNVSSSLDDYPLKNQQHLENVLNSADFSYIPNEPVENRNRLTFIDEDNSVNVTTDQPTSGLNKCHADSVVKQQISSNASVQDTENLTPLYCPSPLSSPDFTYPTPPASHEELSPCFSHIHSIAQHNSVASQLSSEFYSDGMSSPGTVEAALNELLETTEDHDLPMTDARDIYHSGSAADDNQTSCFLDDNSFPHSPILVTPEPSPVSAYGNFQSPDFYGNHHAIANNHDGAANATAAAAPTATTTTTTIICIDKTGSENYETIGNCNDLVRHDTNAIDIFDRHHHSVIASNRKYIYQNPEQYVATATSVIIPLNHHQLLSNDGPQEEDDYGDITLHVENNDEEQKFTFRAASNLTEDVIQAISQNMKSRMSEINDADHYSPPYKSRLRKHEYTTSFSNYTPRPMLNPNRNSSGLYWQTLTNQNNAAINASNNESTSECGVATVTEWKSDEDPHINIGLNYQADVCQISKNEHDSPDTPVINYQIWDPKTASYISSKELKLYLELACCAAVPGGGQNTEYALNLLHLYNGDVKKAISQLTQPKRASTTNCCLSDYTYPYSDLWSLKDIEAFQKALQTYDKCFHLISKKVKTKSTKQCVEFYYLWKKACPEDYKKMRQRWDGKRKLVFLNGKLQNPQVKDTDVSTSSNLDQTPYLIDYNDCRLIDSQLRSAPPNQIKILTRSINNNNAVVGQEKSAATTLIAISPFSNQNNQSCSPRSESADEFPCKMCGKMFNKIQSRSAHMRCHRTSETIDSNKFSDQVNKAATNNNLQRLLPTTVISSVKSTCRIGTESVDGI